MWSNSIINEFPTYYAQYAVELLHSLGCIFDNNYLVNENLRNIMIDFAKRDDKCFYELALHAYGQLQINDSFDLMTVFNDEEFNTKQDYLQQSAINQEKNKLQYVATVYVTPNSTRLMPLESTRGHRALRHNAFNGIQDFCLVYLKPDSSKKYINQCTRYKEVFESGIEICNFRYHLFGLSNSQLREHSYWFIRATSLEEIHQKRQLLGDFSSIYNIGKYVARLGLWFSKSEPTRIQLKYISNLQDFNHQIEQGKMCITMIDDIERNTYCFTDGCGLISKGLAKLIAQRLNYLMKSEEIYPSGYQIRIAGCKGFVIIDPESKLNQFYIKIRPSMKKFESNNWDLDICDSSQPIPTRLNNQIIILMSDLGISDSIFLNLQKKWLDNEKQPPRSTEDLLKNKIPLPMNECRYIFGCALESKLEPGQCFIRYQIVNEEGKPKEKPEFQTVVGKVIVTKNPCPYAGDIMTLEAVDIPELHCLQDVFVFSTKGDRPDCNKIAGSDLDGDQYFVYWGQELQLPETIEPLEYPTRSPTILSTCITPLDFIDYCLSLLGATTFGEIYNLHAIVVDQHKEKHLRRTCQKLAIEMANMFSVAIDAGKTGYQVDRKRIQEIRKLVGSSYPDFLMKSRSYPSQPILGILYRNALEFKNKNSNSSNVQDINDPMNSFIKPNERNFRFYVKVRTALNIDPQTISQELQSVFDKKSPSNMTIERWSLYYRNKNMKNTQSRELSTEDNDDLHISETESNTSTNSDTTNDSLL